MIKHGSRLARCNNHNVFGDASSPASRLGRRPSYRFPRLPSILCRCTDAMGWLPGLGWPTRYLGTHPQPAQPHANPNPRALTSACVSLRQPTPASRFPQASPVRCLAAPLLSCHVVRRALAAPAAGHAPLHRNPPILEGGTAAQIPLCRCRDARALADPNRSLGPPIGSCCCLFHADAPQRPRAGPALQPARPAGNPHAHAGPRGPSLQPARHASRMCPVRPQGRHRAAGQQRPRRPRDGRTARARGCAARGEPVREGQRRVERGVKGVQRVAMHKKQSETVTLPSLAVPHCPGQGGIPGPRTPSPPLAGIPSWPPRTPTRPSPSLQGRRLHHGLHRGKKSKPFFCPLPLPLSGADVGQTGAISSRGEGALCEGERPCPDYNP